MVDDIEPTTDSSFHQVRLAHEYQGQNPAIFLD